jgi:hypothetical protein
MKNRKNNVLPFPKPPTNQSIKNWGGSWFAVNTTAAQRYRQEQGTKLGEGAYQEGAVVPKGSGKTSWVFGNTKHELRGTSSHSDSRAPLSEREVDSEELG